MKAYLFDTNIWSRWFKADNFVTDKIAQLDGTLKIFLSSVVLGEAIYGANVNKSNDFDFKTYSKLLFHRSEPKILEINRHVSDVYGKLKASLFEKYTRKGKNKRPEQLIDPVTATEIGIDENDLWIVAQAITYNLILVTNDKMNRIFSVTPKKLMHETWR